MGRKTKLTPELQDKICQALRAGNYIQTACDFVGISHEAFFNWLEKGEKVLNGGGPGRPLNPIYGEFSEAVKKARSAAVVESVLRIRKAGQEGQWQADAWYLERTNPQEWGRRIELTGKDGSPLFPAAQVNIMLGDIGNLYQQVNLLPEAERTAAFVSGVEKIQERLLEGKK